MNTAQITREAAADLIRSSGGSIFFATFTKRTTGETREMRAKLGIRCDLKGGSVAYDFADRGLIGCFDMDRRDYRCINITGLTALSINGSRYVVSD
jgi:hypothetical protein